MRTRTPRASEMTLASSHEFEEHRGEIELRIDAPSLSALFVEAARAVAGKMDVSPLENPAAWTEEVVVTASDREALLVGWLNELVYRSEFAKVLFTEFEITHLSDRQLVAGIHGKCVERLRNPVKAATYNGLSIEEGAGGFTARVVLEAGEPR